MKITQRQLRQIIKEELARTNEMYGAMPPRRFGATPEEVQKKIDFYLGQGSRMWMMGAMSEYEDMASGGDGFGIRSDYYPNWNDGDFAAVLAAVGSGYQHNNKEKNMRVTSRQLRQLIRESVIDHMKEQDRDGDGDKDFDDVRMARMMKGGMSSKDAKSKVKSNPMGNKDMDEMRRSRLAPREEIDYSIFDKYDADAVGDALIRSGGSIKGALEMLDGQYEEPDDDDDFSFGG